MSATPASSKDDETKSIADRFKDEAKARIKELEPLVKEHRELTEFMDRLSNKPAAAPTPSGGAGGTKPSTRAEIDAALGGGKGSGKKRRKRQGGTAADKALAIVQSKPGISATEIAAEMKVKPNYLYRVMANLTEDGSVKKDGTKYAPA